MPLVPVALRDLLVLLVVSSVKSALALDDPALDSTLFYPFGSDVGDHVVPPNDDGSTGEIPISIGFPFFATSNSKLFVNTNGAISFGEAVTSYTPVAFPTAHRLIAPFWCDVDTTRNKGRVYYRQSTDMMLLNRATSDTRNSFSRTGLYAFNAKWILIVTWHNVTYYGGGNSTPTNSFQAVLITDGRYSIAMFNYGRLTWTTGTSSGGHRATGLGGTAAQAGFDAGDNSNFFAVPGSRDPSILEISDSTNVGLTGRWIFRVETANIESSNTCGHKGNCKVYQKQDKETQKCIDIAPAFDCPRLEGPKVVGRIWIEFYCVIQTDVTTKDAAYLVTFLFNGEPDINVPVMEVRPPERNATLHERHLHHKLLGTWISCKVFSFWNNTETPKESEELTSTNRYYAGIEVSPHVLSVYEGDLNPAIVTLKSTLPITCDSEQDKACKLGLRFTTSKNILLLKGAESGCRHSISNVDWKTDERKAYRFNQRIELYTKNDLIVSGPRPNYLIIEIDVRLNKKQTADGKTTYKNMWKGHEVHSIQVYHHDRPHAVCRATGDPNLTTLDGLFYSVYESKQFIYVQTTHGPLLEIQVRHKPCGQAVSCACAVAAIDGDVTLIIDRCTDKYVHTVTPDDIKKLPKGVGIKQDDTGRSLEMLLPSGVKVFAYVTSWGMNLEIYLTPGELGRTKGLCGTFDRNRSNDLWVRGQDQPTTKDHLSTVIESWRIPDNRSLFDGYPPTPSNEFSSEENNLSRTYCTCTGNDAVDCGSSKMSNDLGGQNDSNNKNTVQQNGGTISNTIHPLRQRRDAGPTDYPSSDDIDWKYNSSAYYTLISKTFDNISPMNQSNLTDAQANAYCRQVLWEELAVRDYCEGVVEMREVDGIVNKCVSDIKMTGDISWANDKIQEIQSLCMFQLITANITERNISIEDLMSEVRELSNRICTPPTCSDHGVCNLGKCTCNKGYIGADCAVEEGAVPRITELLSQPTCDVDRYLCEKVEFLTEGVAALQTLTCKVEVKKLDNSTQVFDTTGYLKSLSIASCELPTKTLQTGLRTLQRITITNESSLSDIERDYDLGFYSLPPGNPVLLYTVSVSNNGDRYSNAIPARSYESRCFDSDGNRKTDTCLIANYCFKKGDTNPFNPECDLCEPEFSSDSWTKQSDPSCDLCLSSPCSGICISPFKGKYRCINTESRGFVILAVGMSIVSVVLVVFAIIFVVHCRNTKRS